MAAAPPDGRRLRVLGQLSVEDDSGPLRLIGRAPRILLACLALNSQAPLPRERLLDLLWPEATPDRARALLSDALYRLRRSLGPNWVLTGPSELALDPQVWIDVRAFEQLSAAGDSASLEQAAALYAGELLPELYDDWVLAPRVLLHETWLACLLRLGQLAEDRQQPAAALRHYQRLSLAEPLREDARRGQMRALARLGRLPEALEVYDQLAGLLEVELATPPQADTQALAATLRRELELASEAGEAGRSQALPFVGRTAERALLLSLLDQAREGGGNLVVVLGEAGIGKTSLLGELVQAADWRGWHIARGTGEALGLPAAYAPLSQALVEALPRPRRQQLAQLVAPAWLEMASALTGGPHPAEPAPDRARYLPAALRHVLAGLQQIAPQLILLDDVQWSDPALWPLLDGLREALAGMRVLVVVAGRSDELQAQPHVWEKLEAWSRAGTPVLRLHGLARNELARLAHAYGGPALAEDTLTRLEAASGGNPLLALALLQNADPQRLIEQRSLSDLIQRRLDHLAPPALAALQAAAVAGYRFDYDLWQAVLGGSQVSLPRLAGELEQARLIVLEAEGYRFAHDTLRTYVYEHLDIGGRGALHARAFAALAARYETGPDEPGAPTAAELQHHADQAGMAPQVARYARLAGESAMRRYASAAAVAHFHRALQATAPGDLEARFAIVLGLVEARAAHTEREAQQADLGVLSDLARQLGKPDARARAAYHLALFEWQSGAYQPANQAAERGLALAHAVGDEVLTAQLTALLGRVARDEGRYADALALLEKALARQNALGHLVEAANTLGVLCSVAERQGNLRQALSYARQALAISQSVGDLFNEGHVLSNIGIALWHAGEYAEARAMLERSLAISRETGDRRAQAAALSNLGSLAAILGDLRRGAELLSDAALQWEAAGNRHGASAVLSNLAELRFDMGDYAGALARFDEALALNRDIGRPRGEAYALTGRGCALLELGRPAEARAALQTAAEIRRTLGERGNLAQTLASLVCACLAAKDTPAALAHAQSALGLLDTRQDSPALLRDVHFAAYSAWAAAGRAAESESHLRQAAAAMQAMAADLPPEAQTGFANLLINRRIRNAAAARSRCLPARLARAGASLGRRLADHDYVHVEWTLWAPGDEQVPAGVQRRRHVLRRLLDEAEAAGAAPTDDDLARALGVSRRSILRDMAQLAATGARVSTRRRS
jgi:DNA-binding SARP family transcriptional activator/tetratricopeptide (TPR) repeat protein